MKKYILIGILLVYGLTTSSWAQETKFTNGKEVKIPTAAKDSLSNLKKEKTDSTHTKATKEKVEKDQEGEEAGADVGEFVLFKELSTVEVDTLAKVLGELQVVQVSEELKIDCVWVKSAEYYTIWNSEYVNPYQRDAALFRDTVDIELYNLPRGELWAAPLETTLQTSSFGYRWGRFHHGIDLNLHMGTPIFSVFDGIVRIATFTRGYGNYVVVRHRNGLETLYAHMSALKVEVGQVIKAGQLIGLGGSTGWSTGPHLHFEVRYEGNSLNPLLMYNFSLSEQLITDRFSIMPHHFNHLGNKIRQTIIHKVVPGETLGIISAKYNVPVSTIARLNKIAINSVLYAGQTLIIK